MDGSYGDLEVKRLVTGFDRVYIRTRYIDVELDVDADAGFDMDLASRYGDISVDTNRAKATVQKDGSSKSVKGHMPGKGTGRMDISTSYGDISID